MIAVIALCGVAALAQHHSYRLAEDPGSGAEGVVADAKGNLYVSVVRNHTLRKYVKQ